MRDPVNLLRPYGLTVLGGFHPGPDTADLRDTGTVLLIGPDGPHMWPVFSAAPEYLDGAADPLDRWSKRVIGVAAAALAGRAVFPSDGPPYPPFVSWALLSGQAHLSPVQMLVHGRAGLMVSFRGAILLPDILPVAAPVPHPCESCVERPCLGACPVGALGEGVYDVGACRDYVRVQGRDCRSNGCLVRRACPVSLRYGRPAAQSGFHMEAFL